MRIQLGICMSGLGYRHVNRKGDCQPTSRGATLWLMCLAVPGKVLTVSGDDPLSRTGRVSFGGVIKEVSLAYTPEAEVDDYVIVHVGFALSVLDQAEAARTFDYLRQMGELEDLEAPDEAPTAPA